MKQFLFITLLGLLMGPVFAQGPGGMPMGGGNRPAGEGTITGLVIDKQTHKAVEYANIIIFHIKNQQMLTGTISDLDGKFLLEKIPFGMYKVTIDFIGYEKIIIDNVQVNQANSNVDLGERYLSQTAVQLEGVEVVADKISYEYKIDKKVVNVSQDATAAGGTAADVLENTPSVEVDIEGNVTMRGSSNFTVLINGRPSVLDGSDALQQLPAANIENIEIITNPSAKFDPDGTAGIINVITKKKNEEGLTGVFNASAGLNNKYRSNVLLNYRIGKWSFTGGFDFRDDDFKMERESYRETYSTDPASTDFLDSYGDQTMNRKNIGGRFGIEYFFSENTVIGFNGRVGTFKFGFDGLNKIHNYSSPATTNLYYLSDGNSSRNSDYFSGNLNFQHKFDNKGHQLDFMFDISDRGGDSDESTLETETDAQWNPTANILNSNRSVEDSDRKRYQIQLDYVKPFGEKGKFESGYQARMVNSDDKYLFEEFIDGAWVLNTNYTSESSLKRNIQAVYAILNNETKSGFGYQFGLRGEYTFRETGVEGLTDVFKLDRFDLFPSVHVSKQLGKSDQIMLSYTRRINRPRGWNLDPFISYVDENTRRRGNPELKPEYIDSFEFGWQKRLNKGFMNIEAYYKITTDLITRVFESIEEGGDEYILHTSANLDKDYSFGTELMINYDFSKKLNMALSGTVYYYKLEGSLSSGTVDRESTNWSTNLNTVYKFTPMTRVQMRLGYNGPSTTAQGERKGMFRSDMAIRHDFWNRKATLTLQFRDFFGKMKHEMITDSSTLYERMVMKRESPMLQLSFSYKLNNFKQKRSDQGGEDMDMDMGVEY